MEEAPENSKESSYSAHANGMNEWMDLTRNTKFTKPLKTIVLLMGESQVEHIWKQMWAAEIRPMVCGLLNTAVQYQTHLKAEVVHNFV
jgi:hypothetical protein